MPAANVLINTTQGVLNEIYSLDQLRDALYWYRSYTEQIEEQFDLAVEGKTNSLVILEELPRTREIIDQHDEMMDRFDELLDEFEEDTARALLEEFSDEHRCGRIPLGWLEDEGVPAGNGVGEHPHGDHGREVERRDAGHHA